jgi:hypothetical protein
MARVDLSCSLPLHTALVRAEVRAAGCISRFQMPLSLAAAASAMERQPREVPLGLSWRSRRWLTGSRNMPTRVWA